jgi:hypothetical protein
VDNFVGKSVLSGAKAAPMRRFDRTMKIWAVNFLFKSRACAITRSVQGIPGMPEARFATCGVLLFQTIWRS